MYKELIKRIKYIKKSKKKKVFYFGNTAKKENNNFYLTNIQENNKFIYFGAIIFNNQSAQKIAKLVDGKVDLVLVDIEKKVFSKKKPELINIERSIKDEIKKSKIFTYKGNDLTVQACETLINYILIKDPRGIGGKKILILGSGNIGFKIALKLVESGGSVFLYRRNKMVLRNLVDTINYIRPKATIAKSQGLTKLNKNLGNFDIIIGATNGRSLIKPFHVESFKKNIVIIDIGKGIFEKKALLKAVSKKIDLYRLDITPAYDGYLENIYSTEKINNFNLEKSKNFKKFNLVKRGILSPENSIIVDNVNSPKKIYGISNGYGGFKQINRYKIKILKKKVKD